MHFANNKKLINKIMTMIDNNNPLASFSLLAILFLIKNKTIDGGCELLCSLVYKSFFNLLSFFECSPIFDFIKLNYLLL